MAEDDRDELYRLAMKVVDAVRPLRTNYSPYSEPPAVAKLREALREFDEAAGSARKVQR